MVHKRIDYENNITARDLAENSSNCYDFSDKLKLESF